MPAGHSRLVALIGHHIAGIQFFTAHGTRFSVDADLPLLNDNLSSPPEDT